MSIESIPSYPLLTYLFSSSSPPFKDETYTEEQIANIIEIILSYIAENRKLDLQFIQTLKPKIVFKQHIEIFQKMFHMAVIREDIDLIRVMKDHSKLKRLIDGNFINENGFSFLMYLAFYGIEDILEYILLNQIFDTNTRKIVDINAKDKYVQTALMYAAMNGHKHSAFLLMCNGADPNIKNSENKTAKDIAMDNKMEICANAIAEWEPIYEKYPIIKKESHFLEDNREIIFFPEEAKDNINIEKKIAAQ